MSRVPVTAILLALAISLVGCAKGLPEDKAEAILQSLAGELVKLEGAAGGDKMAKVKVVCEKEGVEVDTFARYLDEHPDADRRLGDLMQQAFEADLATKKKAYAAEIAEVKADASKAAIEDKAEILVKKQELENAMQAKIAELQNEFKTKEQDLKIAIAKIRAQQ